MPTIPHVVQCVRTIMTDALDGGGRQLTSLRFADGIDGLSGNETEIRHLMNRLEKASKDYGMEISGEKTKFISHDIPTTTRGHGIGAGTGNICMGVFYELCGV